MRHDAHLWMQPNPARFLLPGTDPADVYPALARQRDQANAAFAAKTFRREGLGHNFPGIVRDPFR